MTAPPRSPAPRPGALLPGILLCVLIGVGGWLLQLGEERWVGRAWLEALVLAILLGAAVRTAWTPGARWKAGIAFSAKQFLELAVVLLGATLDLPLLLRAGPALLGGIALAVVAAIAAGYGVSRALGLRRTLATLVACGNAICGNSAIAAVAPVIGADADDVAAAISFTAVLGVLVVLGLPALGRALGLSDYAYGVVAGLSVYAVPQVIAATFPVSTLAGQVGTLVKLVRVLMLGPVVVALSLQARRRGAAVGARPGVGRLVPWFIVGFLLLAVLRAARVLPGAAAGPAHDAAAVLTVLAMAALGLGVDVRALARVGGRVTTAVVASLAVLLAMSVALVRGLHLG